MKYGKPLEDEGVCNLWREALLQIKLSDDGGNISHSKVYIPQNVDLHSILNPKIRRAKSIRLVDARSIATIPIWIDLKDDNSVDISKTIT